MKKSTIHQLLVDSRPPRIKGDAAFVARTMQAVRHAAAAETFDDVLRTASTSKKESLFMKFRHLPKLTLVAVTIAAAVVVSGTAYAAIRWLEPKIDVTGYNARNDANNNQYAVDVHDCGVLAGGIPVSNGKQVYEVASSAHLSRQQVIDVLKDTCKYQQILQMIGQRWNDDPGLPGRDAGPGYAFDTVQSGAGASNIFGDPPLGTVTAKGNGKITISSKIYESYDGPALGDASTDFDKYYHYYEHGKMLDRTFDLHASAEVVKGGETGTLKDIAVGDTVYFMTKNHYVLQGDRTWGSPTSQTVVRLIKTDINPDYIQSGGLGNPNIVGAIAKLEGCQGNGKYLCVAPKSTTLAYDMIYAVPQAMDDPSMARFTGNNKYARTDIPNSAMGNAFHAIEGHVTGIDGTHITLTARGKSDAFTLDLPYDAIKRYNDTHGQHIAVGDVVQAYYLQKPGEDHHDIKPGDLTGLSLLQRRAADGTLMKY